LLLLEVVHVGFVLSVGLSLVERGEFTCADAFLFLFLLLSKLQFFVTSFPELGEFFIFLFNAFLLFLKALNLKLTGSLNGELHLHLTFLLSFKESVGLIFSLSNLLVQDLLLVVLDGAKLSDLPVDHAVTLGLLLSKALRFLLLLHKIARSLFLSKFFNTLFFL